MSKKNPYLFCFFILVSAICSSAAAQGCSDAGFCTITGLKPGLSHDKMYQNKLKAGAFFGKADYAIKVWGNYLEYNRDFNDQWTASAKLTTLGHFDPLIHIFGLGDLFLSANYKPIPSLILSFGSKIPLTNGDRKYENHSLPMHYQSSLGTFDLIGGVTYLYKHFSFNAGIQIPLVQNMNMFLPTEESKLNYIGATNAFMRAPDILLRATYAFVLSPKFTITPGLLPIFHIYNDKYINADRKVETIAGSGGVTLNANLYLDYKINHKHSLQFSAGAPFIVRRARPDGLTRHFVASLEYSIGF